MFDPDKLAAKVVALHVDVRDNSIEQPVHRHRKAQLVLAHRGTVMCYIENGLWMVPPGCGVWIPGNMEHSNRVSVDGEISLLFVEPSAVALPTHCCTLLISPLVKELIVRLGSLPQDFVEDSPTGRLTTVLLEELAEMPVEQLHLPFPANVRLRKIANMLIKDPSNRNTIEEWASEVAMSERSLSRLVIIETGMTFGRWRRQLRVIAALHKLSTGSSVQRVSDDLGYDSVSAFITMFKNMLGRTPGYYLSRKTKSTDSCSASWYLGIDGTRIGLTYIRRHLHHDRFRRTKRFYS